ncbi:hypothetical protein B0H13DRAFT_2055737 [Mycena leptocephala]|nr:hypothetical protein B0H13DRAFT_2055737 [Mycena leptocephala]
MVNRRLRLRLLCLPIIFKITRCTSSEKLEQPSAECMVNSRLIRQLDVVEVDTRCKSSTSRISFPYFILNSLPTLTTVAVRDSQLKAPTHILSSTDQNRSRKKKNYSSLRRPWTVSLPSSLRRRQIRTPHPHPNATQCRQ